MKKFCFLITLLFIGVSLSAQYVSTVIGGSYENDSTWVGSKPRGSVNQNMTINGYVVRTGDLSFGGGTKVDIYKKFEIIGTLISTGDNFNIYQYGYVKVYQNFNAKCKIDIEGGRLDVLGNMNKESNSMVIKSGSRVEIFGNLYAQGTIKVEKGALLIIHKNFDTTSNSHEISGDVIVKGNANLNGTTMQATGNLVVGGNVTINNSGGSYQGDIYQPNGGNFNGAGEFNNLAPAGNDKLLNEDDALLNELGNLGLLKTGWTGDVSSDWNNANNWSPKKVPLSILNVNIDVAIGKHNPIISSTASMRNLTVTKGTVTIKAGAKATIAGNIDVKSGGNLIIEHDLGDKPASVVHYGTSTGNVTVKVTFPTMARNWYLGHPVVSNRNDYPAGFNVWSYFHGVGSTEWPSVAAGTSLSNPTAGYVVQNTTKTITTVSHNGALATGEQKVQLKKSSPLGFNLIANPYNGYVNPNSLDFTGMRPTIWFRTVVGGYYKFQTYNIEAGVTLPANSSDLIAPMQAFWVRTDVDKELKFSNGLLSLVHPGSGANPHIKSSAQPADDVLYLEIANNASTDQTAIAFREIGSVEMSSVDSDKRLNDNSVPDIYVVKSGKQAAIAIQPQIEGAAAVNIGFALRKDFNKSLSISAVNIDRFMPGTMVWLVDNISGIRTDLRSSSYEFESAAGVVNNRFSLEIGRVSTGVDNTNGHNQNDIKVFAAIGKAVVEVDDVSVATLVNIYNLSGQLVKSVDGASSRIEVELPAVRNVYIVEVLSGNKVYRHKIVN